MNCGTGKRQRRTRGQAQSGEFAVALLFLFLFLFFPFLDFVVLAYNYVAGYYLNFEQLRQAVGQPRSTAPAFILQNVNTPWNAGLGKWVKESGQPTLTYAAMPGSADPANPDITVTVKTTTTSPSFLPIPFMNKVPGLGGPITFTYTSQRMLENPADVKR